MYETPIETPPVAGLAGAAAGDRAPIFVAFAGPAKQQRLTVAFRFILAFPQAIALAFIGLAVEVVLVIGWFGALFMGRLPAFAADFLAGYLRWQTRYCAYVYLLTGVYPPFSFQQDPGYPVQLAMRPGKLNRFAVLFRLVLAIWAGIVEAVVAYGFLPVLFIGWLIVLVRGTMPSALHQAIAAVVRYQARVSGYLWMLTAEYPWGLFGDGSADAEQAAVGAEATPGSLPAPDSPAAADAPAVTGAGQGLDYAPAPEHGARPAGPGYEDAGYELPPDYGEQPGYAPQPGYGAQPGYEPQPGYGQQPGYAPQPGYGAQPGYGPQPGYGQPPGHGTPPSEPGYEVLPSEPGYGTVQSGSLPAGRASWQLFLSSSARQLVGLFVILGVILIAVVSVVSAVQATGTVNKAETISQVQSAHGALVRATASFGTTMSSCQTKANPLPCVTSADRAVGHAFGTFSQAVRASAMPSASSSAAADRIASVAAQLQRIFQKLGSSGSLGQYQQTIQSSDLQRILNQFDADYSSLGTALNAG